MFSLILWSIYFYKLRKVKVFGVYLKAFQWVARTPLVLVFFASLCKLFRAFLLFIQRKELKDKGLRKGERDDQEREKKKRFEDEVIPTHLEVTGTSNSRTSID